MTQLLKLENYEVYYQENSDHGITSNCWLNIIRASIHYWLEFTFVLPPNITYKIHEYIRLESNFMQKQKFLSQNYYLLLEECADLYWARISHPVLLCHYRSTKNVYKLHWWSRNKANHYLIHDSSYCLHYNRSWHGCRLSQRLGCNACRTIRWMIHAGDWPLRLWRNPGESLLLNIFAICQ